MQVKSTLYLLITAILLLSLTSCSNDVDRSTDSTTNQTAAITENKTDQATTTSTDLPSEHAIFTNLTVTPPLPQVDVPYRDFKQPINQAKVLTLASGTSIEIPAAAFVDANGKAITEEVNVHYREFRTPAEIIASGIPMRVFDKDNTMHWMQTAGMFEIKGDVNGTEVFLAPDKTITVNMATEVEGDYDFWHYDTATDNWRKEGESQTQPNPRPRPTNRSTAAPNLTKPKAPVQYDRSKMVIDLNIDYAAFPELKELKGRVWQYAGADVNKDPSRNGWVQEEEWNDISLQKSGANEYLAVFTSDTTSYTIPVQAVQRGADYAEAYQQYRAELQAYETRRKEVEKIRKADNELVRTFKVSQMGIYNYDIFWKAAEPTPMLANFDFGDQFNQYAEDITVYLITGDQRAVLSFPYANWRRFQFDAAQDNALIAVLPDNKVATFTQRDFTEQQEQLRAASGQEFTFGMSVQDEPVTSLEDLREIL